jgi:hypothetical protein
LQFGAKSGREFRRFRKDCGKYFLVAAGAADWEICGRVPRINTDDADEEASGVEATVLLGRIGVGDSNELRPWKHRASPAVLPLVTTQPKAARSKASNCSSVCYLVAGVRRRLAGGVGRERPFCQYPVLGSEWAVTLFGIPGPPVVPSRNGWAAGVIRRPFANSQRGTSRNGIFFLLGGTKDY